MLYELLCDGQHPYPNSQPMIGETVIDPERSGPASTLILPSFSFARAPRTGLTASPRLLKCGSPYATSAITFEGAVI